MNKPATFSITIPKPCHEDWNKMTPDEKGAFCGSCQKSVYDFSGKTDAEVSEILMANRDKKICGRFDANQLERPVDIAIPVYNIPTNISPLRAFALALFLVFGTFLFNCSTASGQKMGKLKYVEMEAPDTKDEPEITMKGQVTVNQLEEPKVMGGPKFTPVLLDSSKTGSKQLKTNNEIVEPQEQPKYRLMGDVDINYIGKIENINVETPIQDTLAEPDYLLGDVVCELPIKGEVQVVIPENDTVKKEPEVIKEFIMGKPSFNPDPVEDPVIKTIPEVKIIEPLPVEIKSLIEPVDTVIVKAPVIHTEPENNTKIVAVLKDPKPVTLEVMPNPSRGQLKLRYSLKEKNFTAIELYDMSGTKVKAFVNLQMMYEGTYHTNFDISDLPDGIYICTLRSGDQTASNKVILTK